MNDRTAVRWINLALGIWLFVSAFAWPHTHQQYVNALIVGTLYTAIAAVALHAPQVRFLNVALSLWLAFSAHLFPTLHATTSWNSLIVALLVLVVTLMPSHAPVATSH